MARIALGIYNRQTGKSGQSPSHHGNWTLAGPGAAPLFLELLPSSISQGRGRSDLAQLGGMRGRRWQSKEEGYIRD